MKVDGVSADNVMDQRQITNEGRNHVLRVDVPLSSDVTADKLRYWMDVVGDNRIDERKRQVDVAVALKQPKLLTDPFRASVTCDLALAFLSLLSRCSTTRSGTLPLEQ